MTTEEMSCHQCPTGPHRGTPCSVASSSPSTTPLCFYCSHRSSLRMRLASFDEGIFIPLLRLVRSIRDFSRALHRNGSLLRHPHSAASNYPQENMSHVTLLLHHSQPCCPSPWAAKGFWLVEGTRLRALVSISLAPMNSVATIIDSHKSLTLLV